MNDAIRGLLAWLEAAPAGTLVSAQAVADRIRELELAEPDAEPEPDPDPVAVSEGWQVRLWTVPAETRLSAPEVCEAVGRSIDWLYRHTSRKAEHRIPHRKLDGELLFVAGEVREWIRDHERRIATGPTDAPRQRLQVVGR